MNLRNTFAAGLMLALFGTAAAGCKTHGTTTPIGDGYEEVTHPERNYLPVDEPLPPRTSLQYRSKDGTITPVWQSLYGVNEVIHGGVAVFVGDKAYVEEDRVTHPRLFAVKAPAPPVDITDEVIRGWAQANSKSPRVAQDRLNVITPEVTDGGLLLHLEFSTPDALMSREVWPDHSDLLVTWPQLDSLMHTVKTKGTEQKDLRWGTPYIGENPKQQ